MKLFTGSYIGGRWRLSGDGSAVRVDDPATGEPLAEIASATVGDCLEAVEAAAEALPHWRAAPPRVRAEILRGAFELMVREREQIAELIVRENGKVRADALAEADYAAEFFRWFSEEAVRIGGDFRTAPGGDKRIVVTRQAIGVSVLITPWNFPAAMATRKIGPALAAGCTVVLKPAAETPLTALYLADLLERAGVPSGVVNVVVPDPPADAVRAMLSHPAVRKLSFTGSTEVGRVLLRTAADQVLSCSMELGGNAPFIVLDDADIDAAVAGAMVAKMRNGGAACTAANRFYVAEAVHDAFVAAFGAAMDALPLGPGTDPDNALGSLVSVAERDKVAARVTRAVEQGATVQAGGTVPAGPGAFYPATVLSGVRHGDDITRAEIFGPVAPIIAFGPEDDVAALANDTELGLISYVYTGDLARGIALAERLETGMVALNRGVASDPAAPFGGAKQSGLGREGAAEGIQEFLEEKYIALDLAGA
ncbi:succinate-semialdehyde dehydrogenase / glutarate-semialdehyde dehydrogenase [Thermomonospora echinospora]|uniref:Succinate-semialdehyde dehydrogenase / glutarate-semialdehyde dehydrogenase n=1 Tax=Thermomonospora echinospora TaxID=1992 RepID=A0A1H6E3R0_9ACTN|nr:NAD-dependent succinate-semialdehyde dehydrogenase [Thermomonospora echinospora]SEG91919.1 succinate-semialdehyde dehydrogenase / glutarate-semialdehyde dehydrogenase [Thermomonospora echinospora]